MPAQENNNQIPFTVHGFVTDPKSVGYQMLTNYECIYWRTLVGTEAWSLYEVLRSFCHGEETSCYPSIKLLCDILGLKDRRRLTGRKSISLGKEYKYPGLIEILQSHDLVIAEVIGEEPVTSYIFHVNLTPSLLTNDQLKQLPETLQHRHRELLRKHEIEVKELKSMKRISKVNDTDDKSKQEEGGKLPPSPWQIAIPSPGKLPSKQQPYNNTHSNNNVNPEDVVVKLINWGFEKALANKMVTKYGIQYVEEKIELLESEVSRTKIKSPSRWLYKAIETNFVAPKGFRPPNYKQRLNLVIDPNKIDNAIAQDEVKQKQVDRKKTIGQLREKYQTKQEDLKFWDLVKNDLKRAFADNLAIYNAYISNAEVLCIEQNSILLGFASDFFVNQLSKTSIKTKMESVLMEKAGHSMKIQFEVVKQLLDGTS